MLTATVIGNDVVAARFRAAAAQMNGMSTFWVGETGEIVKTSIQQNILRQGLERTGALFYSGRTFGHTKRAINIGFGKGLDYAYPLEHGSRAHMIYPGSSHRAVFGGAGGGIFTFAAPGGASVLSFYSARLGEWVFAKSVQHPGNKPYKFVYHGTLEAFYPIMTYLSRQLQALIGGLSAL